MTQPSRQSAPRKPPFRRVLEIAKHEGWRSLWFRAIAPIVYHRTGFLVCALEPSNRPPEAKIPVEVRLLTANDVDAYLAFRRGAKAIDYHARLDRGFICYAAWSGDRIASVTWNARNSAILWLLDAEFDLKPGQVYCFDSFTHPDFRGQRIQAVIYEQLKIDALAKGDREAVTFVIPENTANMRSRGRQGFKRIGLTRRFKFGPWWKYVSDPGVPAMRRLAQ